MKRTFFGLVSLALLATPLFAATPELVTKEFLSETYTIEKKYRSMEGPGNTVTVYLDETNSPELLWVTGVRTEMVGEDGKTPQLPEFMCHVNVDIDPSKHQQLLGLDRMGGTRLITLSQGMLSMKTPAGFGYPLISNEPIQLYTQVLNHNIENPKNAKVRHRVTFEYYRDRDLQGTTIKPLLNIGASGMVLLNEDPKALPMAVDLGGEHGATCLMAQRAPNAQNKSGDYIDPQGRHMTGHWIVPPGRQTNHSDVTWFMNLPYDTKLHYAAIHLHPFAESLEMRDITADKSLFKVTTKNPKGKIGLDHVDTFVSPAGVPLFKDHKYELISVYNNTSTETHDSMASVFLGVLDPSFKKPDAAVLRTRANAAAINSVSDSVMMHTSAGQFGITLTRAATPATVREFLRLAQAGAFNSAKISTASADQPQALRFTAKVAKGTNSLLGLGVEPLGKHRPGALSVCAADQTDESVTFSLMLANAPQLDGKCTAFATIGPGSDVVRALATTQDASLTSTQLFTTTTPPVARGGM
jgi:cyclophilin family peptidyl-prolyl cis-trans isomerase